MIRRWVAAAATYGKKLLELGTIGPVMGETQRFLLLSIVAIFSLLWAYFRRWHGVLIPFVAAITTAIWGLGFTGWMGFDFDAGRIDTAVVPKIELHRDSIAGKRESRNSSDVQCDIGGVADDDVDPALLSDQPRIVYSKFTISSPLPIATRTNTGAFGSIGQYAVSNLSWRETCRGLRQSLATLTGTSRRGNKF